MTQHHMSPHRVFDWCGCATEIGDTTLRLCVTINTPHYVMICATWWAHRKITYILTLESWFKNSAVQCLDSWSQFEGHPPRDMFSFVPADPARICLFDPWDGENSSKLIMLSTTIDSQLKALQWISHMICVLCLHTTSPTLCSLRQYMTTQFILQTHSQPHLLCHNFLHLTTRFSQNTARIYTVYYNARLILSQHTMHQSYLRNSFYTAWWEMDTYTYAIYITYKITLTKSHCFENPRNTLHSSRLVRYGEMRNTEWSFVVIRSSWLYSQPKLYNTMESTLRHILTYKLVGSQKVQISSLGDIVHRDYENITIHSPYYSTT